MRHAHGSRTPARPGSSSAATSRFLNCVRFECAALYIGGDSGPLHIASTSAVPIVALYGPTLPARSAPWRSAALIAEAAEPPDLPCRPCDQRQCEPGDFRCLGSITPSHVLTLARRALASRVGGTGPA